MKLWKRNAVVVAIVLFVGIAVYLNWSYNSKATGVDSDDGEKLLGQTSLVNGETAGGEDEDARGELVSSTGTETNTNPGTGYFATARLNRQQARDNAKHEE